MKTLILILLFVSSAFPQSARIPIGHSLLRDTVISTKHYFEITTDTMTIFRKQTLFNSNTYLQGGLLLERGSMDTIRMVSNNSLWIRGGGATPGYWRLDSIGNLLYYKSGTNWWFISSAGAAFFAGGVTQNGALLFQNYLYGTTFTAGTNTPDSLPWNPSSTIADMRFKKNGTHNETVYIKESSSGGTLWSAVKTNSADTMPSNSGTISLPMTRSVYSLTPRGDCTINATNGQAGNIVALIVTTTGTTSWTLTFNTNYKTTGTLATGVVSGKVFTITFACSADNVTWVELARTTAM